LSFARVSRIARRATANALPSTGVTALGASTRSCSRSLEPPNLESGLRKRARYASAYPGSSPGSACQVSSQTRWHQQNLMMLDRQCCLSFFLLPFLAPTCLSGKKNCWPLAKFQILYNQQSHHSLISVVLGIKDTHGKSHPRSLERRNLPGRYRKLNVAVAREGMTLPAAGCVVTPVATTVVRTADDTSPGSVVITRGRSCRRGLRGGQSRLIAHMFIPTIPLAPETGRSTSAQSKCFGELRRATTSQRGACKAPE
jgi:hypothetical protein